MGGQTFLGKNMVGGDGLPKNWGGGDGLLKKWGGVGMRGRSPREPAHPSSGCFWHTPLLALI